MATATRVWGLAGLRAVLVSASVPGGWLMSMLALGTQRSSRRLRPKRRWGGWRWDGWLRGRKKVAMRIPVPSGLPLEAGALACVYPGNVQGSARPATSRLGGKATRATWQAGTCGAARAAGTIAHTFPIL